MPAISIPMAPISTAPASPVPELGLKAVCARDGSAAGDQTFEDLLDTEEPEVPEPPKSAKPASKDAAAPEDEEDDEAKPEEDLSVISACMAQMQPQAAPPQTSALQTTPGTADAEAVAGAAEQVVPPAAINDAAKIAAAVAQEAAAKAAAAAAETEEVKPAAADGTEDAKSQPVMVSHSSQIRMAKAAAKSAASARPLAANMLSNTRPAASGAVPQALIAPEAPAKPVEPAVNLTGGLNPISSATMPTQAPATPETAATPMNHAVATATVVQELHEAAERLRATGPDRLELQVRLQNGEEVSIKLRLHAGQVEATVRTESQGLRDALEQNWARQAPTPTDRTQRINLPVFEAANARSGSQEFSSRQQRRESAPEEQPADSTLWSHEGKRPATAGSRSAAAASKLYA